MVLINGKPQLEILIDQLKTVGVNDITIVVHYMKEKIINHFGDGSRFSVKIRYVEQKEMKGTADAVLCAEPHVKDKKFFLIFCDSLFETDLLERLLKHKSDAVFTCREVKDPSRFGILMIEGNKVVKFIEKPEHPPSHLASFSVFIMTNKIFSACKKIKPGPKGEYWLTDAIQLLIDGGTTFEYEVSKHILDIGTHEQLAEAQDLARELGL